MASRKALNTIFDNIQIVEDYDLSEKDKQILVIYKIIIDKLLIDDIEKIEKTKLQRKIANRKYYLKNKLIENNIKI